MCFCFFTNKSKTDLQRLLGRQVIRLAPQHVAVRHTLAELLLLLSRDEEALEVLEQDETLELDVGLLLKRAATLLDLKKYDDYFSCCLLLFSRHGTIPRNREELFALVKYNMKPSLKNERVRAMREFRGENPTDDLPAFSLQKSKTDEEEYEQFRHVTRLCMEKRRFALMQKFAFMGLSSTKFKPHVHEMELIAVWACFYNDDYSLGYNVIREMMQRRITNPRLWNLFNLLIQRTDDLRHNRFVMRLLSSRIARQRENAIAVSPIDPMIHVVHANNCLVAGTYKYALNEYMETYRSIKHPMVALLIALTLLQMACQKFTDNKDPLLVQTIAFLGQYKELRGEDGLQEVNYNMGRAFHQMGAAHLAVHYYKLVLKGKYPLTEKYPELLDLRHEAAYNLHLLYRESGNADMANRVLMKYLTI